MLSCDNHITAVALIHFWGASHILHTCLITSISSPHPFLSSPDRRRTSVGKNHKNPFFNSAISPVPLIQSSCLHSTALKDIPGTSLNILSPFCQPQQSSQSHLSRSISDFQCKNIPGLIQSYCFPHAADLVVISHASSSCCSQFFPANFHKIISTACHSNPIPTSFSSHHSHTLTSSLKYSQNIPTLRS